MLGASSSSLAAAAAAAGARGLRVEGTIGLDR